MRENEDRKILFISHDASRSGAPITLLTLLRWLRSNSELCFEILLGRGGALEQDFRSIGHVLVFYQEPPRHRLKRIIWRIIQPFLRKVYLYRLKNYYRKQNIALIYANTIATGEILEFLSFLKCPVICHVHELEYVIGFFGSTNFEHVKNCTGQYISCSEVVKNNLICNHNIPCSKIETVYGFVRVSEIRPDRAKYQVCEEFDIPKDAPIVCMSAAYLDWRKAPDIFILLARDVYKKVSYPVHFLWVGGYPEKIQMQKLMYDIDRLRLSNFIHFLGEKSNPFDYFAACDVFALVSREDPFPLVCLEAASLGKPIVCFDKAGGMPEFVEDDCGFIVPYLDTEAMAEKIIELIKNPELRQRLGERARKKVKERFDVEVQAPKILSLMQRTMNPTFALAKMSERTLLGPTIGFA